MEIDQDSFFDIIWPVIRNATSSEDCAPPFDRLKAYFEEHGYVLDSHSESLLSDIFEDVSDVIRNKVFHVNSSEELDKSYKQCCDFLRKSMLEMARVFKIPPIDRVEAEKEFTKQANQWFDGYEDDAEEDKENHLFKFKNTEEYFEFLDNPQAKMQKLRNSPINKMLEEMLYASGDLGGGYGAVGSYVIDATVPFRHGFVDGVNDKQVREVLLFLSNLENIEKKENAIIQVREELRELQKDAKLSLYHEDKQFIKDCKKLISVLTGRDRYHGTNYSALDSISENGLYMVQRNMDSTSYTMNKFHNFQDVDALLDDLLLFRTGFDKSRGDGIVFLKGDAVVKPVSATEDAAVDYSMTGPMGIKYKVSPSDIIGTIDAVNNKVEFGAEFEKRKQDEQAEVDI